MSIASRIRALRLGRRMTIKDLAAQIGVPASTYRDWEYGRKVSADKLQILADTFEVSISELLGGDGANRKELNKAVGLLEEAVQILRKI